MWVFVIFLSMFYMSLKGFHKVWKVFTWVFSLQFSLVFHFLSMIGFLAHQMFSYFTNLWSIYGQSFSNLSQFPLNYNWIMCSFRLWKTKRLKNWQKMTKNGRHTFVVSLFSFWISYAKEFERFRSILWVFGGSIMWTPLVIMTFGDSYRMF